MLIGRCMSCQLKFHRVLPLRLPPPLPLRPLPVPPASTDLWCLCVVFSPCAYNPIKKPHVPLHEMCRDTRGKVPLFSLPGEKGRSFYKHFSVVCFSLNIILGEFHPINVEKFPLCIIYSTITLLMAVNFVSRILLPNDAINIFGGKNKQKHHNYLVGGVDAYMTLRAAALLEGPKQMTVSAAAQPQLPRMRVPSCFSCQPHKSYRSPRKPTS